jgi:cytochrome c oxidase cbb3-type subunit 2
MWGPTKSLAALHSQRPPLIGNRRQGPDLAEVGGRCSALWLKMHFFNPAEVSGSSIMPSYGFLFRDQRGNDLVAYLKSLRGPGTEEHIALETQWDPSGVAIAGANPVDGLRLYNRDCATCHSPEGRTRIAWRSSFMKLPPNLAADPPTSLSDPVLSRFDRIAQITKFGIPGTDMPGHEYLSDRDIASISLWLTQNMPLPVISKSNSVHTGEER